MWLYILTTIIFLFGVVTMDSVKITLDIVDGIEEALDLGYTRLYVNVDNNFDGTGFLRVLAMYEFKDKIVFEGTFPIDTCYDVLDQLAESEYDIKDFTTGGD